SPERRLGIRKVDEASLLAGLQHRLEPPGECETAVLQHDGAKVILAGTGMTDRDTVQRNRSVAGNHSQPVGGKALKAGGERSKIEPVAIDGGDANLRCLPLH